MKAGFDDSEHLTTVLAPSNECGGGGELNRGIPGPGRALKVIKSLPHCTYNVYMEP